MSACANSCIFVAVNTILQCHCITCFRNVKLWILGMTRVEYLDLPKVSVNFAVAILMANKRVRKPNFYKTLKNLRS
jgi:hypothetical protein